MPSGFLKLVGVLLLLGSIGVVGVQACSTKDPRSFSATADPATKDAPAGKDAPTSKDAGPDG